MEKYEKQGFVERDQAFGFWIVTGVAAAKFGFQSPELEAAADCESAAASTYSSAEYAL
jgi:hypothetical protein